MRAQALDSARCGAFDGARGGESRSALQNGEALRDADRAGELQGNLEMLARTDPAAFRAALEASVGEKLDAGEIEQLRADIASGDFEGPEVRFVDAGALGGDAYGAYSSEDGGTIYLDRRLLGDPGKLEEVYAEEFGHHIDARVGGGDTAGDEGALFARTLYEGSPGAEERASLKGENDIGLVVIDGRDVLVEFHGYDEVGIDTPASPPPSPPPAAPTPSPHEPPPSSPPPPSPPPPSPPPDLSGDPPPTPSPHVPPPPSPPPSDTHGYDEVGIDTPASGPQDLSGDPTDPDPDPEPAVGGGNPRSAERGMGGTGGEDPPDEDEIDWGATGGDCPDCHGTLPDPDAVTTDADRAFVGGLALDMTIGMTGIGGVGLEGYRAWQDPSALSIGTVLAGVIPGPNVGKLAGRTLDADNIGLNKQLASEQQMNEAGQSMAGAGTEVEFRDAQRVAAQHGGEASDWSKRTSSSHTAPDGTKFETHWVENVSTGQRVEYKTKFSP